MKKLVAIAICLASTGPALAHESPRFQRPEQSHSHSINPWPFIAGAVIGGLVVHAAETPPAPPPRIPVNGAVLVNGVWMKRVQRCVQNIVIDSRGDQYIGNVCNYVYVPVE